MRLVISDTAFSVINQPNALISQTYFGSKLYMFRTYINNIQQDAIYAGIYLLQNYCTCFGCLSHPSSEVHQGVTAASGTGHSIRAKTFCQRGLIRPSAGNIVRVYYTTSCNTQSSAPEDG